MAIVEDAAQSQGATRHGARRRPARPAVATSFYPGKNLGAAGDAGAVTDRRPRARPAVPAASATHGSETKYDHEVLGFNSRLDAIQAVVLRAKLAHLDAWNEARRAAAAAVRRAARRRADVVRPAGPRGQRARVAPLRRPRPGAGRACWRTCNAAGIGAGIHYPTPVHLSPAFADLGYGRGDFPVSEAAADAMILSLPIDGFIRADQQERVAVTLREALARA